MRHHESTARQSNQQADRQSVKTTNETDGNVTQNDESSPAYRLTRNTRSTSRTINVAISQDKNEFDVLNRIEVKLCQRVAKTRAEWIRLKEDLRSRTNMIR